VSGVAPSGKFTIICRPVGTSAVVRSWLSLIEAGALDHGAWKPWAERLGSGTRQLRSAVLYKTSGRRST